MPTYRQKLVASKLLENGGNIGKAMIAAGYSPATAITSQNGTIKQQIAVQKLSRIPKVKKALLLNKAQSNKQKSKKKAITKKYTLGEIKRLYLIQAKDMFSADRKLEDFEKKRRLNPSGNKELIEELCNIFTAFELDTHITLSQTAVDKSHATLVVEFCRQIIREYSCHTPSEKALAELIAGSFVRQLACAERLKNYIKIDYLSSERNTFMANLSKELERATRSFLIALTILKQFKSLPTMLNVQAITAFIAQNQQVNAIDNRGYL